MLFRTSKLFEFCRWFGLLRFEIPAAACCVVARGREPAFVLRVTAWSSSLASRAKTSGADRDRTDDLMLAKHALSQLSYGPVDVEIEWWLANRSCAEAELVSLRSCGASGDNLRCSRSVGWWARDELNVRPHAYQACALTT